MHIISVIKSQATLYDIPNTNLLDWLKAIKTKYTKAHYVLYETLFSRSLYHSIP